MLQMPSLIKGSTETHYNTTYLSPRVEQGNWITQAHTVTTSQPLGNQAHDHPPKRPKPQLPDHEWAYNHWCTIQSTGPRQKTGTMPNFCPTTAALDTEARVHPASWELSSKIEYSCTNLCASYFKLCSLINFYQKKTFRAQKVHTVL